ERLVDGGPVAERRVRRRPRNRRRAGGAREGQRVVAGVREVRVAVRVGCGHGRGLRAAGGLRRGARDDEARRGGGGDGDCEPVAAGGGDRAVVGGDGGAFGLVELHQAGGGAG